MTLSDKVREVIRRLHLSRRTEEAYVHWTRAFVVFHGKRHPRELGGPEVVAFLNHLAVERDVSASTQNQALCALVFLYKKVLGVVMPELDRLERAKRPRVLPTVMSAAEVAAVIGRVPLSYRLICELLYGSGLRLMECLTLRVKDVDFERSQLNIKRGKGAVDRAALFPLRIREAMAAQLRLVEERHKAELRAGRPGAYPPQSAGGTPPMTAS